MSQVQRQVPVHDLGGEGGDGWMIIKIHGVEKELDIFECYHSLLAIYQEHKNQPPNTLYAALQSYIQSLSYPTVSQYLADAFVAAVYKAADALKKKADSTIESSASSPDSMASGPEACPAT